MAKNNLRSTPSRGRNEMLTGLLRHSDVRPQDLLHHYFDGASVKLTDVEAAASGLVASGLATHSAHRYALTASGLATARTKRSTRLTRRS